MGKVVKTVIGVAVGIAIAVAAPYLAGALLGAMASATAVAVATAVIAAGLAAVAGIAMKAIGLTAGGSPRTPLQAPWSYPQGTAVVRLDTGKAGRARLTHREMEPVRDHWLRHYDVWGLGRFKLVDLEGDCLGPDVSPNGWGIVDLKAPLRSGDLMFLKTKDQATAFSQYSGTFAGVGKRFIGIDRDQGLLECECSRPPRVIHTGLGNIRAAHRIVEHYQTKAEAQRALRRLRQRSK